MSDAFGSYHPAPLRHGSGGAEPGALARWGDLVLRVTSRRAREAQPPNLPEGWQLRLAAPVWYGIWSRDEERLRRLRVVLMPIDITPLSEDERLALLVDQLSRLGAGPELADWLKPALTRARQRLSARIARLD